MHNLLLLGETALLSYAALVAGETILKWFKAPFSFTLRRIAYALLAGYGAIGFMGTLLGAIGAFTPQVLWSVAVFGLVAMRHVIRLHWRLLRSVHWSSYTSLFKNESRGIGILRFLVLLWLIVNAVIVFVPITGHDTLDYHLPVMRSLVETGTLDLSAGSFTPLPVFGEVLYAVPMAMFHETAAPFMFQLLQYIVFVLFVIIVYSFLKDRTKNALFPFVGVLGLLSLMDLWREVLHGGYVDVIGFVYGLVSMLIVIEHVSEKESPPSAPLTLSALFLGFAVSIKYTGLIFGACNGIILIPWLWWRKEKIKHALAMLSKYALIVLVVAGFWYAKNAVVFQNPIYPLASDAQATEDIGFFLMDRTLPNLFIFPFYRYAQWFVQDNETSSRLVVLGYLITMYLLLVIVLLLRRKLRASEWSLVVFIHFYFIILFFLSHQYRFLLPATMGLPILLALLGDSIIDEARKRFQEATYRKIVRTVLLGSAIAFLLVFAANIHYFAVKFRYIAGLYSREEYILEIGGQ